MAKGMGTKGGVLSQKETARENRAFQTKSADSLQSVDKNLKDLTSGISKLNSNVQSIKIIEGAQLAHDIKMQLANAAAAKGQREWGERMMKNFTEGTYEGIARSEAGLHDISRAITKLHSMFLGETDKQAVDRYGVVRKSRSRSLDKHRNVLTAQREFLKGEGVDNVNQLSADGRKRWRAERTKVKNDAGNIESKRTGKWIPAGVDDQGRPKFQRHDRLQAYRDVNPDGSPGKGRVGSLQSGMGGSGTGGGRNTPARVFAALLKNTDTTNLKLDEVIEILRGNRLLELENKKEGKSKKSRFGKTKGIALGGLATLLGGIIGAGIAGAEAITAKKLAKELKAKANALKAKKLAASQKAAEVAKAKDQLAKKNLKAKAEAEAKIKSDRIAKEKAANAQKAQAAAQKAAEAKAAKKLARIAKEKAANAQKAAEAKAAEKIKKTEDMNAKKAKETGKIKAYLKKASVADLKSWLKNLRLASTIGKAKSVLAWNPAGWVVIALLFVAEELAIGYVTQLVEAELAERAKKEKAEAKAKPKSEEFVVSRGGTIVPINATDDQLGMLHAAKQNLKDFNHRTAQTNEMLGKDWYTKPAHAKTYDQFQQELKRAVFDVRDAQADMNNTSNVVNSGNTNNTNTTVINYGNTGGTPAGNGL